MWKDDGSSVSFWEGVAVVSYVWLFVCIVSAIVSLAQYLYKHLQWVA